jgi:hypothetical protein
VYILGNSKLEQRKANIEYDKRLEDSLNYVCSVLFVKKEDFASLALANLLSVELEYLERKEEISLSEKNTVLKIKNHKKKVDATKTEVESMVIKETDF